jgi:cytochrome bd-type quinol oxidase subunit 1
VKFDTITTVLRRALALGAVGALVIGVGTGLVGLAIAGVGGLWSGLVGAVLSILFLGITALGILAAGRLARGDSLVAMAVLMGGWFVKLILFVVAMIAIGRQPWVVPGVLLASIVGTVLVTLVVDCVVVARSRIPVSQRV